MPRVLFTLIVALLAGPLGGAELTLRIEPRWQHAALTVPSGPLLTSEGQTVRITRLAAIVSEIRLQIRTGETVRMEGQFGAIDAETGQLDIALQNVPAGDYVGLELQIGVPSEINHGDPGRWPAGHALNPLVNGLHWSWQGGYVFLALEGRWQAPAGAGEERGFLYHLGTDARRMTVRFDADFRVEPATMITLAVDVARVLRGHRLVADDESESTHSGEGDALAPRLAEAVERAWFWLGAEATSPRIRENGKVATALRHQKLGTPLAFTVPAGFPQPALPTDNLLSRVGVALGEALFFDGRLSGTGTQSCASCHEPARAFSDAMPLSRGVHGMAGTRNTMPLFNLAWASAYAWDGGQSRIRDQALAAIRNPLEMDAKDEAVVGGLGNDAAMKEAFASVFGEPGVSMERIGLALEQYLLTLVSADARFDRALRGEVELTAEEKRGFELFLTEYDPARGQYGADCFHCHGGALFTDFGFKNNGLTASAGDGGRSEVSGLSADRSKFKTPSLRNVGVTGPYMHDGRIATLEAVVAHYDHGVARSASLDANLAKHPAGGMALSSADQRALVAFLGTLTDVGYSSPSQ